MWKWSSSLFLSNYRYVVEGTKANLNVALYVCVGGRQARKKGLEWRERRALQGRGEARHHTSRQSLGHSVDVEPRQVEGTFPFLVDLFSVVLLLTVVVWVKCDPRNCGSGSGRVNIGLSMMPEWWGAEKWWRLAVVVWEARHSILLQVVVVVVVIVVVVMMSN